MQELTYLLNHVSTLSKKNDELLDAMGGRFNMFGLFGVDHYENTHSAIISEFLNSRGSHGLKEKFLKAFIDIHLKSCSEDFVSFASNFDLKHSRVFREFQTLDGRIDILIDDNNGHGIIIENKIYAIDQWEQLRRYDQVANNRYHSKSNYKIFYLTINGIEASNNSAKGIDYIQISYSDFIIEWLVVCISISVQSPLVRETLIQYMNHIKKLTNQDMNTKNQEDVINLIMSSTENIKAAFTINENLWALKEFIVKTVFNKQLHEIAEELQDLKLKVREELTSREKYHGFSFNVKGWNHFYIYFDFDGNNFQLLGYMFALIDKEKKHPDTIAKLRPKFSRHNNNNKIPCGWNYMENFQNWNNSEFLSILNGDVKEEIKNVIIRLFRESKDLDM